MAIIVMPVARSQNGIKNFQKRREEPKPIFCPNCNTEHKWGRTGEYCTMTCFYAKLEKDRLGES